ncbi:MAG TPA: cupredoxin domain-containing protein [Pseudolabrys sp.]|nr:cupredoxin domain-containing protein [Pseudolabrys sp.]
MRTLLALVTLTAALAVAPVAAQAAGYTLTLKNHRFTPREIKVPANKRVQLTVINKDATPEEFDSDALKVEKVLAGNSKGIVRIGPLKPGKYPFMGEYHESTAKGVVIAE